MTLDEQQMLDLERAAASLGHPLPAERGAAAAPQTRATRRSVGTSPSRPTVTAHAAMSQTMRTLSAVDSRLVALLDEAVDDVQRRRVYVEAALLVRLRRTMLGQLEAQPSDVVFCESVVEYAERSGEVLLDLEVGGVRRCLRLISFLRELTSEITALGGNSSSLKQQVLQIKTLASKSGGEFSAEVAEMIDQEIRDCFVRIQQVLESCCSRRRKSWLDEVVKISV